VKYKENSGWRWFPVSGPFDGSDLQKIQETPAEYGALGSVKDGEPGEIMFNNNGLV